MIQRFWPAALAALLLLALGIFFFVVPREVDRGKNGVALPPGYEATPEARVLHNRLFVADLHDDALLWSRDLLRRHDYGHTDLPRLQEGRVALQVFSTVTKAPRGINFTLILSVIPRLPRIELFKIDVAPRQLEHADQSSVTVCLVAFDFHNLA